MRSVAFVAFLLVGFASAAAAQGTVRVTVNDAPVYSADFAVKIAVVKTGTLLAVTGRQKDWYEVRLPDPKEPDRTVTGFVYVSNVEQTRARATLAAAPQQPVARPTPPAPTSAVVNRLSAPRPPVGVVGFATFGVTQSAATQSFSAFAQSTRMTFGGGAEVRFGAFFVNGSIDRLNKTGVYVVDGEAVDLGIPQTITQIPITMNGGWRFRHDHVTPYGGAGLGRVLYKESAPEGVAAYNATFNSYQFLGGAEFRNSWLGTAFEMQYSRVPNAGVPGGVSQGSQTDLSGLSFRVKVVIGR